MSDLPKEFTNPKDGYQMILVPAGVAIFGSAEDERGASSDERPQFRAHLPDYYLGKYPVRNKEYARFLDEVRPGQSDLDKWILLDSDCHVVKVGSGYRVRGVENKDWADLEDDEEGWANHPVRNVSWYGAVAYCEWAGLRLPRELEWEKGARGTDGRIFPWGDGWDPNKCQTGVRTSVVWEYGEGCSVWGHYQMVGNLGEWCEDWYEEVYHWRTAMGELTPPADGSVKISRGAGGFFKKPRFYHRCAKRFTSSPGIRVGSDGFRCVRGLP